MAAETGRAGAAAAESDVLSLCAEEKDSSSTCGHRASRRDRSNPSVHCEDCRRRGRISPGTAAAIRREVIARGNSATSGGTGRRLAGGKSGRGVGTAREGCGF